MADVKQNQIRVELYRNGVGDLTIRWYIHAELLQRILAVKINGDEWNIIRQFWNVFNKGMDKLERHTAQTPYFLNGSQFDGDVWGAEFKMLYSMHYRLNEFVNIFCAGLSETCFSWSVVEVGDDYYGDPNYIVIEV